MTRHFSLSAPSPGAKTYHMIMPGSKKFSIVVHGKVGGSIAKQEREN